MGNLSNRNQPPLVNLRTKRWRKIDYAETRSMKKGGSNTHPREPKIKGWHCVLYTGLAPDSVVVPQNGYYY
eukprot:scaffold26132_cov103-Cylindrotheca_fusiformis.AAC.2